MMGFKDMVINILKEAKNKEDEVIYVDKKGKEFSLSRIMDNQEKLLIFICILIIIVILTGYFVIRYVDQANYVSYVINTIKESCIK